LTGEIQQRVIIIDVNRFSSFLDTLILTFLKFSQQTYLIFREKPFYLPLLFLLYSDFKIKVIFNICHDIMSKTYEILKQKQENRRKSPSTSELWPIVKLDAYKKLTNTDRTALKRAKVLDLMTIVYEAASTSASISELVRIWREASEQSVRPRRVKSTHSRPSVSYEEAFRHLLRKSDNRLHQIAVHASLISTDSRSELQRLGEIIRRNQFDIYSIRESSKGFQNLIKF
jgi:hypothetical protein